MDDDADARDTLAQFLALNGYRSSEAKNGQEALEQVQAIAHRPQLILLDLDMPVMDGREFLSRLPLIPCMFHPAVIVITGNDPGELPGVAAVLRKPISISRLLSLLQAFSAWP